MSNEIQEIATKLNEINEKLDVVGEGLNSIVDILTNLGDQVNDSISILVNKVEDYANKVTLQGQTDFERSRSNLEDVAYEINSISTSMLGPSQIISASESLSGLLEILDTIAFDPEEIKSKLKDIEEFIAEKKGDK
ncbi:MAG: hypothetical protein EAX96_04870 [Candidatus Lokiarchaeota archaeon]|nr:hypothetical protein [Candidatus Lokiarchaeota archaeon]